MKAPASFTINNKEEQITLLSWMKKMYPKEGYNKLNKLIRTKYIKVNNSKVQSSFKLSINDKIDIYALHLIQNKTRNTQDLIKKNNILRVKYKKQIELLQNNILFSNEDYLIINKPLGLATQQGSKIQVSLSELLPFLHDGNLNIVHRLDKYTTGIIVLAKTPKASKWITKLFKNREIQKEYIAIISPLKKHIEKININAPLIKKNVNNQQKVYVDHVDGKAAITNISVVSYNNNYALIHAKPKTGRTHQIRVHSAYALAPLVGDIKYGYTPNNIIKENIYYLHAYKICFKDLNGNTIKITCPIPNRFMQLINDLQLTINL